MLVVVESFPFRSSGIPPNGMKPRGWHDQICAPNTPGSPLLPVCIPVMCYQSCTLCLVLSAHLIPKPCPGIASALLRVIEQAPWLTGT